MSSMSGMMLSGIDMAHFNSLAASPADSDLDRPLNQCADENAFVIGRAAHIGLRISRCLNRFDRAADCLLREGLTAQSRFRVFRSDRDQADTTERDRRVPANVAVHG